jgi:hypothetical protein
MPKPKYCQHPTRHATSKSIAKGGKAVSLKLSAFLMSQYDIVDTRIRWLCPRCHMLESNEMKIRQPMQINNNRTPTDDESTAEDTSSGGNDDEEGIEEVSYDNEEDKDSSYSIDDMETETNDSNEEIDDESMEEDSGDVFDDLEYHQNEAIEKLSSIFRLLNIDSIHDK